MYYQNTSVRDVLMEIASTVCYDPFDVIGFGVSLGFLDHEVKDLLIMNPTSISSAMYQMLSHCFKDMCHGDENCFISRLTEAATLIHRASTLEHILERLYDPDHKAMRSDRQALNRTLYLLAQMSVEKYLNGPGITKLLEVMYTPAQLKMYNWPNADARLLIFQKLEEMSYRVCDVNKCIFDLFEKATLVPAFQNMCYNEKELRGLLPSPPACDDGNRNKRNSDAGRVTPRKRALKLPSTSSSCSDDDSGYEYDCSGGRKISRRGKRGKIPRCHQRSPASPLVPPPSPVTDMTDGKEHSRRDCSSDPLFAEQDVAALDELTVLVNTLK